MKTHNMFEYDGYCEITTPTIYYAIHHHILDVKLSDMWRVKYDPKYEYHEKKDITESKREYSIDKRSEEINNREVFGHFELDTVIGKGNGIHECLMTLTERKTRYEMIFKLQSKSSKEVVKKFNQIKKYMKTNFNKIFKSITTDNGIEFSDFLKIIENTKMQIYFCHPYCSGEKGTNEKHNSIKL